MKYKTIICALIICILLDTSLIEMKPPIDTKEYVGTFELTAYIATGNACADGAF